MAQCLIPRYSVRYSSEDYSSSVPLSGVYSDDNALAAVLSVWPEGRAEPSYPRMVADIYGQDGRPRWSILTTDYDPASEKSTVLVYDNETGGVQSWTIHVRRGRTAGEIEYRAELAD